MYIYIHIQIEICRERLPILASREPLAETAARHGPGEVPSDAVWAVLERGAPGAESLKRNRSIFGVLWEGFRVSGRVSG